MYRVEELKHIKCSAPSNWPNLATSQSKFMLFIVIEQSFLTSRRKAVGVSGNIHLDVHGDRIADYALLDMVDEQRGDFEVVMEYYSSKNKQRVVRSVNWPGGERPVDRPFCGFDNSDPACKKIELPVLEIAITTVCGLTVICAVLGIFIYSSHKQVRCSLCEMRDVQHENIARFIGVCIDVPHVSILTEYCPKGSLMASFKAYSSICNTPFVDVLQNDSLKLDWMFKYSLINDIVKALTYLHSSEVGCHGRLTSRNCFVDSLFVLKVTDFGLPMLRAESTSYSITSMNSDQLLWCAPELLKQDYNPKQITKKGDVYSFSIILQEIILRDNPYCMFSHRFSNTEIIERVKKQENPRFRPQVEDWTCMTELYNLMVRCWTEEPDQRPDFYQISDMMKGINRASDGSGNIMDDLLRRMEQYANNLEALVEQRTKAFLEEKKKSEELLYCVLPKSVAEQLKTGMSVVPETFDSVTIFFSDIVGFTSMCTQSTPRQVVDFLNDLYTCFDHIINDFNVYKVETIGDAYMVVSGLPERNGNIHAKEIARMALSLLKSVQNFCIRHQQNSKLNLRIGIHTGSCCAGVVGKTMPRYCLFGDTVNTASRMEATGLPHHIHVSSDTKTVLDSFGTFIINPRGEIEVKGKGKMFTYWLVDEHKEMDNLTPKG
ncbi:Atrial natriuretic peptide receptor 2 [Nymphon striatum]|nr:Atrial natriuretic peptide receptor 2 [Nymphon striatum]